VQRICLSACSATSHARASNIYDNFYVAHTTHVKYCYLIIVYTRESAGLYFLPVRDRKKYTCIASAADAVAQISPGLLASWRKTEKGLTKSPINTIYVEGYLYS
jgi:hypothetical protein